MARLISEALRWGSDSCNVVGLAKACDATLIRQYRYTPYGRLTHAEDGDGAPLDTTGPSPLESFHLFQGLWVDPLAAELLGFNPARRGG